MESELRILELFSGIGGMHYALNFSDLPGQVVAAMDINTVANEVYEHNHPDTSVMNRNIQKLNAQTIHKLNVNTILMSPPCQPHTRVGLQRDVADNRSEALTHLCTLIPQCPSLKYILMENVAAFSKSQARDDFIAALQQAGFYWREFELSPTSFGVPNTRTRYYCVARKQQDFDTVPVWEQNPKAPPQTISSLLDPEADLPSETRLPANVLSRRIGVMDIVTADSTNTMCFTKAYTHYSEGTGSVFCPLSGDAMHEVFVKLEALERDTQIDQEQMQEKRSELLNSLQLRYFTPREVARLMSFPETFTFPAKTTSRQKYRLLGNSINVRVVGELIKVLCS